MALQLDNFGFSEQDYNLFAQKVQTSFGVRLTEYKVDQMRRRISTLAKQAGFDNFITYFAALRSDSSLLSSFLDHMTINVTELMRNPDLFEDMAKSVLPGIIERRKGAPISIWSAGCSYGAEAYTVAMLMAEVAPMQQYRVRGTDIDLAALAKANQAVFSKADMNGVSPARRAKHFIQIDENNFMANPVFRRNISFNKHDMLADDYPADSYDLILCRNVVIYFNDEAKERIYRNFWKALRPDGVLFVGGTERLGDFASLKYKPLRPFFYQADKSVARPQFQRAA
ncbi:MAG TPA: protein-glutamate O-methyltransferase CheR [Fimbriimonas sp.]|nr:protein-glutamate O-methyltransferase CheR [Fimbriimonas sp.]